MSSGSNMLLLLASPAFLLLLLLLIILVIIMVIASAFILLCLLPHKICRVVKSCVSFVYASVYRSTRNVVERSLPSARS